MKRIILTLVIGLLAAPSLMAVPALQLYIEGATYDDVTDTWVTSSSNFTLWVVASHLDKKNNGTLYDIGFSAALGEGVDPASGSMTVTPTSPTAGPPTTYNGGDFIWGTPPPSDPMPAHGIFPASYVTQHVADNSPLDPNDWFPVQDYIAGSDGGTDIYGYMWGFNIQTTYSYLHFDAFGFYDDQFGKRVFAPFSHDAEMVPEPATALLMGLGLMGAGIYRRFKK